MPVFQNYEPQVTPDIGQTPRVSTNGEAIGQGLQNLGQGLLTAGEGWNAWDRYQERQQKYDAGLSFDNLRQTLANQNADFVRNQQPGAAGLADQGMKSFDATVAPWVKSLPKNLQEEYAPRIQGLRLYYQEKYTSDQFQGRGNYELATNAQEVTKDQGTVATDPGAVQHVLENRFQQIDNMSVSPAQKALLKDQAQRALASTYLDSSHGTDPAGASQALGITIPGPVKVPSAQIGASITKAAAELGTTPQDLATVINYESGFSTERWGGTGGKYFGLIQFGPEERQQFGVHRGQSFDEQMGSVVAFLKARGFKPGMGILDLYSTINAGSPGHYDASDGRNTVRGHVAQMVAAQGGRAKAVLDGTADDIDTAAGADQTPRFTQPGNPLFNVFSPEQRQQMFAGVQANASRDRGEVTSLVKDDIASIEATGQGNTSLSPQRVGNSLGNDAADGWLQQRQAAQTYYAATKDFSTLSDQAIQQRLTSLAPQPGQPGFIMADQYYAKAQQVAQAVMQQRQADPAGAVAQPNTLASPQAAKARLAAQTSLGIPAIMQSPITAAEAQPYALALTKALPGQEKQALQEITQGLIKTYGPENADAAMSYILGQAKYDASTKAIVGSIFRKLGLGQPITRDDARQFDDAQKTDAANKAVAGILGPNQGPLPTPDTQAIDMLRSNPGLAPKFDAVYGPGRAAQVLQFNAQVPAPPAPAAPAPPDPNARPQSEWQPSANFDQQGNFKAPDIPPPAKPAGRTPTSGNDAFQQERQQFGTDTYTGGL
ncbi:hypothetical protein LMIY3S_04758 [Labrys miyagiensis]